MIFISHNFMELFLPLTIVAFYAACAVRPRLGLLVILAASLVFCSVNGVWQTALLACSISFNFAAASLLSALPHKHASLRKYVLIWGIAIDVAVLVYFKYAGFIVANLASAFGWPGPDLAVTLPIGISFYTFTQIAFLADTFAGRGPDRRSISNYVLFVTYFPHVIAGPIIHWREMMPQFEKLAFRTGGLLPPPEVREAVCRGMTLLGIGLGKKIFIADQLAPFVEKGYSLSDSLGFTDSWLLSLAYTFQLYYDFSGYSDMAVGMSLIFSIKLPFNFNSPYQATSIQDFWQRWHMTLSRWLRDYIYIPIGGSHGSELATLRNLFVTFLIGGIWHGAGWTFIAWGALHGLACCIHRLWKKGPWRLPTATSALVTFLFVNITWVFFRAPDLLSAVNILCAMASPFRSSHILPFDMWILVALAALPVWLAPTSQRLALETSIGTRPVGALLVGACVVLAIIAQNTSAPSPFLYFNF
jgi:D-alanyl-lipoteichoic acid acyltransferase DltB (MBOAT superfamily)